MALFGTKDKTTKKDEAGSAVKAVAPIHANLSSVLKKPRITEKAAYAAEKGVYVFNIDPRATKTQVRNAIIAIYKVTPVKVNITRIVRKPVRSRTIRKTHYTSGGRKAYVYLKKGDTIQLV